MATSIYQKILEESRTISFQKAEDSRKWFREKAYKIAKNRIAPTSVINEKKSISIDKKSIWKLIMYNYNPKTKKELPYYDTFPIVFPFSLTEDGFYGYNLHYLPLNYRAVFMDSIYGNNSTGSSKITTKLFEICTKRYILRNIKSKIAVIPEEEWELALFLPLQRFQKQSEGTVWSDSVSRLSERKV